MAAIYPRILAGDGQHDLVTRDEISPQLVQLVRIQGVAIAASRMPTSPMRPLSAAWLLSRALPPPGMRSSAIALEDP